MAQTVIGLFDEQSDAQEAVSKLLSAGFTNDNIDISSGTSSTTLDTTDFKTNDDENESGVKKFFKNLFGNDDNDADRYSTVASRSNAIVTVHTQSADEAEKAAAILDDNGAVDVDQKSMEYGYSRKNVENKDYSTTANAYKSIPIVEESLEVGKRTVQTGGVRIRSRIVERPVEEQLRLRQETVRVERNTVNRPVTDTDLNVFKESEVEMVEHGEVPVVSKQARVVEEVSLSKEVNERDETITDTVRKTEVDVEQTKGNETKTTDARKKGK